jgi:hypothetical protein
MLQIRKVQPRQAIADILCVGTRAVKEKFRGLVRYSLSLALSWFAAKSGLIDVTKMSGRMSAISLLLDHIWILITGNRMCGRLK